MVQRTTPFSHRPRTEEILAVNLFPTDHSALNDMFAELPWRLTAEVDLEQTFRHAACRPVPVILCERDLAEGSWRMLHDRIRMLEQAPLLIVVSRLADERLWAEVLNVGGHDVLATPFDTNEVSRVISNAVYCWQSTYQLKGSHYAAGAGGSSAGAGRLLQ